MAVAPAIRHVFHLAFERLACRERNDRCRHAQSFVRGRTGKGFCFAQFPFGQVIGLIEQTHNLGGMASDLDQEVEFGAPHRLIHRGHEKNRIGLRQEIVGHVAVLLVQRADAGRVEEPHASAEPGRRILQADRRDALGVARITALGSKIRHLFQGDIAFGAIQEAGRAATRGAVLNLRQYRGQRDNTDGQHGRAEQRVDDATLATIEFADNDEVEAALGHAFAQLLARRQIDTRNCHRFVDTVRELHCSVGTRVQR